MNEKLRYLIVAVIGYGLDFFIAVTALGLFSLNLPAASALGFSVAFVLNYILHEFWTFRRAHSSVSLARFAQALGAAALTLALRSGFLFAMAPLAGEGFARYALLVAAAGFSFAANYALLRLAVFR